MAHKRTTPKVFYYAKELRRNMTPAERKLWASLRDHRLKGLGFRSQHALGPFVVDFCCPAHRLTIELDGESHEGQVEYDAARTEWLEEHRWRELRFTNREIMQNVEGVLKVISEAVENPLPYPPPSQST